MYSYIERHETGCYLDLHYFPAPWLDVLIMLMITMTKKNDGWYPRLPFVRKKKRMGRVERTCHYWKRKKRRSWRRRGLANLEQKGRKDEL